MLVFYAALKKVEKQEALGRSSLKSEILFLLFSRLNLMTLYENEDN